METLDKKCVFVLDGALPAGVLANAAAILGITLGKLVPGCVGEDVTDASGVIHRGIITTPVPVLRGDAALLKELRQKLCSVEYASLQAVDFSDVARGCNDYADYIRCAAQTSEQAHTYLGIAIFGDRKKISHLTGSLPLLR